MTESLDRVKVGLADRYTVERVGRRMLTETAQAWQHRGIMHTCGAGDTGAKSSARWSRNFGFFGGMATSCAGSRIST